MKMKNPVILLDVDGVVADFTGSFLAKANAVTGRTVTLADVRQWDILQMFPDHQHEAILKYTYEPGFCTSIPTLSGAVAGVGRLREIGSVYAVTSPWVSETWCYERTKWLQDHLAFNKHDVLHVPGNRKHMVRGDVLIDDKTETVLEWSEANPDGLALLWDAPYNRNETLSARSFRVYGWDAIIHIIRAFMQT